MKKVFGGIVFSLALGALVLTGSAEAGKKSHGSCGSYGSAPKASDSCGSYASCGSQGSAVSYASAVLQAILLRHTDLKVQAVVLTDLARRAGLLARRLRHTDLTDLTVPMALTLAVLPAVQLVTKTGLVVAGCGLKSRVAAGRIPVAASL